MLAKGENQYYGGDNEVNFELIVYMNSPSSTALKGVFATVYSPGLNQKSGHASS